MLNLATSENIESICSDDPVRPDIPYIWRATPPNFTYYLTSRHISSVPISERNKKDFTAKLRTEVDAVCCIALQDKIPITEMELMNGKEGENAIFYTVWVKESNREHFTGKKRGKGRDVLNQALEAISKMDMGPFKMPATRYVTLSPKTEMARKFHLRNGATLLKENEFTFNFESRLP